MNNLIQNICNLYGETGKTWLANLSSMIETLSIHWNLRHIIPVKNMTFNYVAKAINNDNQPVILKIIFDNDSFETEKLGLIYFDGHGAIELLDHHKKYNALLLEQAVPGTTLKSLYPDQAEFVIEAYADVMKELYLKSLSTKIKFAHIADWLNSIDNLTANHIPAAILAKALSLKNKLLASINQVTVLHGDLHHDNVLKRGNHWVAIDPKVVIGDPEFDAAAFDFIHESELDSVNDIRKLFEMRADYLAQKGNLDVERLKDWTFVRLILSAAWSVEDKGDPTRAIKLATRLQR
jgi:streptomycin 6-kinase